MEFRADALERAARIRMVVMDVDGTMTDGRIYKIGRASCRERV